MRGEVARLIGPFIRTLLSFLVGAACIVMVRSRWFHRRMEDKFADFEDAEKRIHKAKRDWWLIGIFWFLFGIAQVLMFN